MAIALRVEGMAAIAQIDQSPCAGVADFQQKAFVGEVVEGAHFARRHGEESQGGHGLKRVAKRGDGGQHAVAAFGAQANARNGGGDDAIGERGRVGDRQQFGGG